ncbi:MAG: EpsG family protein [Endomicrobiaceae bacterium]|nr:EpsG family protein [Endomicrobiaceae bacterium]
MIYFGLIFLVLFQYLIIVGKENTRKKCKFYLWITGIEIFLFLGLRSVNIGHDTAAYANLFKIVKDTPDLFNSSIDIEITFLLFTKFLTLFSSHPQILFLTTSAFIVYSTMRLIYKYTNIPWLAVFIYLTFGKIMFEAGIIRQSLAIAISFFAFDFIVKRQFLKFSLLIIIASLFHSSALLLFIMYPISFIKPTIKNIVLCIIMVIIIFFSTHVINNLAFSIMTSYSGYEQTSLNNGIIKLGVIVKIAISFFVSLLCWFAFRIKKANDKNFIFTEKGKQYMILFIFSILAILFYILSLRTRLFIRLSCYFDFFNIILIPKAFELINTSKFKNIILICLITFILIYQIVVLQYRSDWNMYVPYEPFWENLDCVRTSLFLDKIEYIEIR